MKKGRSESAALTGGDRGPATSRELHSFLECCEEDFQALLTPTRQGAPSARKARNRSSVVLREWGICNIGSPIWERRPSSRIGRDAVRAQKPRSLSQRTQSRHVPSCLGWTKRSESFTCMESLKTLYTTITRVIIRTALTTLGANGFAAERSGGPQKASENWLVLAWKTAATSTCRSLHLRWDLVVRRYGVHCGSSLLRRPFAGRYLSLI